MLKFSAKSNFLTQAKNQYTCASLHYCFWFYWSQQNYVNSAKYVCLDLIKHQTKFTK